jgi:hypothetical protein
MSRSITHIVLDVMIEEQDLGKTTRQILLELDGKALIYEALPDTITFEADQEQAADSAVFPQLNEQGEYRDAFAEHVELRFLSPTGEKRVLSVWEGTINQIDTVLFVHRM